MKAMITIMLALGFVGVAAAHDLGNQAPVKPVVTYPKNVPNPERQGGDTIGTATVLSYPFFYETGTTAGYTDNYDEACPDAQSTSPDVVYSYTPWFDGDYNFDLCGSAYDTKLYIYDSSLQLVACNDDYYYGGGCGNYVSFLACVPLSAGQTYYIIIDGYGGDYWANTFSALRSMGFSNSRARRRPSTRVNPHRLTITSTSGTAAATLRRNIRSRPWSATRTVRLSSAARRGGTSTVGATTAIPTGSW